MTDTEFDILSDEETTLLLLYIAGEMGPIERHAIDARLATDAKLREQLDRLARFDAQLRGESALRAVSAADSRHALDATLRLVREQALLLQTRPAMRIRRRQLAGIPRWAWGSAIAACLAVGLVVWISNSEPAALRSTIAQETNGGDNLQTRRGEIASLAAAFGTIEPAGSEGPAMEVDSQVEALNLLAVMNEMN